MKCFGVTHTGLVREGNEDSFFIPANGENYAVLCDGMGGHNAGEVASATAVSVLTGALARLDVCAGDFRLALQEANAAVYAKSLENEAYSGMGTTLTALWWNDETIFCAHVGDSRLYRFDETGLTRLSTDHTVVQELLDMGTITEEEARVHPRRNLITRAVGTKETVSGEVKGFDRARGSMYLLCSDGLTDMLEESEIAEILAGNTPEDALARLLARALEEGGNDNITIVLVLDTEEA